SWPQFGAPAGLLLANGAFSLATSLTGDRFLDGGWRLPFFASVVLVAVGFYIRIGVGETPVFARLRAEGRVQRTPVIQVVRVHWREIVLTALLRSGQQAPFFIFTNYVLAYGTQALGFDRSVLLTDVLLMSALSMAAVPFWGHLSDRVGRRRLTAIGCW